MSLRSLLGASPESRRIATEEVEKIARGSFLGTYDCYALNQGVRESAENFSREKKSFGHYKIKEENIFFINEDLLSKEEGELVKKATTQKTGFPGVLYLKSGAANSLPKEPGDVFVPAGYESV